MTPDLYAACARAVHVITADGAVLKAGKATLFLYDLIGYGFLARPLGRRPLIWFVEWGYMIVADHRPFFARFLFRGRRHH